MTSWRRPTGNKRSGSTLTRTTHLEQLGPSKVTSSLSAAAHLFGVSLTALRSVCEDQGFYFHTMMSVLLFEDHLLSLKQNIYKLNCLCTEMMTCSSKRIPPGNCGNVKATCCFQVVCCKLDHLSCLCTELTDVNFTFNYFSFSFATSCRLSLTVPSIAVKKKRLLS